MAGPEISSITSLPTTTTATTSYEVTPFQPTEPTDSGENYLDSFATTQSAADDAEAPGPPASQELESRIGLSALVDRPPQPLTTTTTKRPGRTSTSSYTVIDTEDDNDEARKSLALATTTSIENDAMTSPMPTPLGASIQHHNNGTSNKILNINDDLLALASSNTSAWGRKPSLAVVASTRLNESDSQFNSSASKRVVGSSWTRPFSDTFFVPQTTSGVEMTGAVPPASDTSPSQFLFGDDGDQQKLIHDTLIPHASVNDLLHIIKHLNLINTDNDGEGHNENVEKKKTKEPTKVQNSNKRPLSQVDMATLESSSSPGKTVDHLTDLNRHESASVVRNLSSQKKELKTNSIQNDVQITTTTRPRPAANLTKLISPYSANFESAIPLLKNIPNINRASVATLKDQIQASIQAAAAADPNQDDAAAYNSKHTPSISKHTIKIGSKPNNSQPGAGGGSKTQGKTRLKSDAGNNNGSESIKPQAHRPKSRNKLSTISSSDSKVARDRPVPTTGGDSGESSSTKRGERDAITNKTITSEQAKRESPSRQPPVESSSADQQQRVRDQNANSNRTRRPPYVGEQSSLPAQLDPSVLDTLKHKLAQAAAAAAAATVSHSPVQSYLDDPHKKSYYWSSEQANMYLGDDYSTLSKLVRPPLTIGELARQHGIINNLRFNHHHHPTTGRQPVVEDFGLLSESGLHEHLAPYSNTDHGSVSLSAPVADKTEQFKLDEDLKQRIAIKAFEAAARDPELSAALFGSLLGLNGAETNEFFLQQQQQQQVPSRPPPPNGLKGPTQPVNLMTSLPTMQDNQVIHPSQLPVNGPSGAGGSNGQPQVGKVPPPPPAVNLVVADLANKWALSRMPDLVPIPLAATVPGYLIRLPNGKILAAALTNMFSIQGIQREPMGNNYKNLINHKFRGLIKPSQSTLASPSSGSGLLKQHNQGNFASLVADSGLRPTLATPLPTSVNFQPAHSLIGTKGNRVTYKVNPNKDRGVGGLFSGTRGVLGQLLASSSRAHYQRHVNNQNKGKKQQHNKLDGANNISKAKMVELIKNLPIADPNEPVFSFADDSELIDEPDPYQTAAASNVNFPHNILGSGQLYGLHDQHQVNMFNHQLQQNQDQAAHNHQANIFEGTSDLLLPLKDRLSHLVNLRNSATLASDDLFKYNKRKRKSPPRLSLAKPLEPILNWLKSKRTNSDINRREPRLCNDHSRSVIV